MTEPNKPAFDNYYGLTKREYFAALALQGLLTKYTLNEPSDQLIVTELSAQLADELINQLNKNHDPGRIQ